MIRLLIVNVNGVQYGDVDIAHAQFAHHYDIQTFSELVHAVRNILKATNGKPGPKTPWTRKMEKLSRDFGKYAIRL